MDHRSRRSDSLWNVLNILGHRLAVDGDRPQLTAGDRNGAIGKASWSTPGRVCPVVMIPGAKLRGAAVIRSSPICEDLIPLSSDPRTADSGPLLERRSDEKFNVSG